MSRTRMIVTAAMFVVSVTLFVGIGAAPRYIEELAIGGGYASAPDGGTDLEADGDVLSDSNVTVGLNEAQDHHVSVLTGASNKAFVDLYSPDAQNGGALWFDGATDTLSLGTRNGSTTPTAALDIAQGAQDVSFRAGLSTKGEVIVGDGSATVGRIRFAAPGGLFRRLAFYTGAPGTSSNLRWEIGASEHAESSTYNGSALRVSAWDNTGTFIDNVIFVERDPGIPIKLNKSVKVKSDLDVDGGDVTAGVDTTTRGVITAWDGSGGAAPGCVKIASPNGTVWYLFVEDDGTLKVHNTLPTSNGNGTIVGLQF